MAWYRFLQSVPVECPTVEASSFPAGIGASASVGIYASVGAGVGIGLFALTVVLVFLLLNLLLLPKRREQTKSLHRELLTHALITGGSSGIGLSIAEELVNRKCQYVTLLARNEKKLQAAKDKLEAHATSIQSPTVVLIRSVDVSDADKISALAQQLCSSDGNDNSSGDGNNNNNNDKNDIPSVTMLFNVAGTSTAASMVDTDYIEFHRLMNINYLGSAYTTKAFLPYMKSPNRKPRAIIFTSSQAGQLGIYGFTAYSASKYALRGLAESLHMEVAQDNISVQMAFPPDTDTPGFEIEQIDKPEQTRLISETSGLFQPESVAKSIVSSALKRRPPFMIYFGLEGWMLSTISAGMSPVHTNINAMCQIFGMGLLRFVSLFYLMDFRRLLEKVARRQRQRQDQCKKEK
jgi:3-dehydrosphinganine reductase